MAYVDSQHGKRACLAMAVEWRRMHCSRLTFQQWKANAAMLYAEQCQEDQAVAHRTLRVLETSVSAWRTRVERCVWKRGWCDRAQGYRAAVLLGRSIRCWCWYRR